MSQFRWRDLVQLNSKEEAYRSPLSVMCHIDVNSFYAQVEQVRCGYTKDDPVVCVQWQSLIAVSYAAKKYGITRMDTIQDAMQKCDKLVPIHTAVFKKGEDFWLYHDGCGSWNPGMDKQLPVEQYKVSLDPYRRESRKIFKIFMEYFDLAEKASVDEVFLDLGRLCLKKLMFDESLEIPGLQRLRETFAHGRYVLDEHLPELSDELREIEFVGDTFNPQDRPVTDWDDVLFALGSQITQEVRNEIEAKLGYTTSCGIARTKNICKLASDFKKPDAQTIVRNLCVEDFLDCGEFEITSFWTLGGNLGHGLTAILDLPCKGSIKYIRDRWRSAHELHVFLESTPQAHDIPKKDMLAEKLYGFVRGSHLVPLSFQTMVKSMTSNKNMRRDTCASLNDCISWLEVFSGELSGRIAELAQEYDKLVIPRTVSVTTKDHRREPHSKSGPFAHRGDKITSQEIQRHAVKLMNELDAKFATSGNYYPLQNLNMTLSNFELVSNHKTVMDMFGKTQAQTQAQAQTRTTPQSTAPDTLQCAICQTRFITSKEYQEHMDFEFAKKLSQTLNSEPHNMSIGERRLLERPSDRQPPKRIKNNRGGSRNILNYFSK